MSALSEHAEQYLAIRRSMGFKLERAGRLLSDFVAFTETAGLCTVTVDGALRWARQPARVSEVWVAQRLSVVRGFARYLCALDPHAQAIPRDLLPAQPRRVTPYLYSDTEVTTLIEQARLLPHPLKAATFATLIGLLAVTGLRGGEAMRLDRDDVDAAQQLLTVRTTKFGKSRLVPLHQSTVAALQEYGAVRDQLCPSPVTASLFVSTTGARLCHAIFSPPSEICCDAAASPAARRVLNPGCMACATPSRSRRCCGGTATGWTCRLGCRCCRPTWGTSIPAPPTGI